jgi:hypothetical protein
MCYYFGEGTSILKTPCHNHFNCKPSQTNPPQASGQPSGSQAGRIFSHEGQSSKEALACLTTALASLPLSPPTHLQPPGPVPGLLEAAGQPTPRVLPQWGVRAISVSLGVTDRARQGQRATQPRPLSPNEPPVWTGLLPLYLARVSRSPRVSVCVCVCVCLSVCLSV